MTKKQMTLCIVHEQERVLLGMKKQGLGVGKWNGFGGKVEPGESIEDAARREAREEAGIRVKDLQKAGTLEFQFEGSSEVFEVHIFKAAEFADEPTETEEMRPQWFSVNEIPFENMWADDIFWFPLFLEGRRFKGTFFFDKDNQIVKKHLVEASDV